MASFDIITSAGKAYQTTWRERGYLLRLAAVPLLVKILFFTLAGILSDGDANSGSYLRYSLITIPALMAEGWMLSHYVRLIGLGHRWPFKPSGDPKIDMPALHVRARGILSGMIVFVLINMALSVFRVFLAVFMAPYMNITTQTQMEAVPAYVGPVMLGLLVLILWGFRLLWLYIPYALNIGGATYMKTIRGWGSSMHFIGVWLLCFMPFLLVLRVLAGVIVTPVTVTFGEDAGSFLTMILSIFTDTLHNLIATAGITYGLQEVFNKKFAPKS